MKKLIFFIAFLFGKETGFCQSEDAFKERNVPFKKWNVNFSFVNLGVISHWHIPINIDKTRPYMYYSIGVQTNLSQNLFIRLDYFSSYQNFNSHNFFNPSVITIAPRLALNNNNAITPFVDLKFGIANVQSEDYYINFASRPVWAVGIRTGLIARLNKKFSMGFSFDNTGLLYKYYYSYIFYPERGRDASRISFLTTDIIYRFGKL